MNRTPYVLSALMVTGMVTAVVSAAPASASATSADCTKARPGNGFYEAGRVASAIRVASGCGTISVSNIRDPLVPDDRCQTFLVALYPAGGGDPTYTDPVEACSIPARTRTVLATDVPAGTRFRVLYQIDYFDPEIQQVKYAIWR